MLYEKDDVKNVIEEFRNGKSVQRSARTFGMLKSIQTDKH